MKTKFAISIFKILPVKLPGIIGKHARAAINCFSRPGKEEQAEKKQGILDKIKTEAGYLALDNWLFVDVGRHWDSVEDYDDINKETYSYFRRFIDGYKLSNLPKNSYVLDICARTGNGALYFHEKGIVGRAVCADFSESMQSVCEKRLTEAGITCRQVLIEKLPLPFKDSEFDAILCFETVEHVSQPDIFIKELGRVVKSQGQIILSTPNTLWRLIHSFAAIFGLHHSEGPCRFISRKRLHQYLEGAGFEITREKASVLVPAGPKPLIKLGEFLEDRLGDGLMNLLALRRIFVCRRR